MVVSEHLSIAPVPEGVDLATAGTAPLAGITALGLIDAVDLSQGDVVLIAGATGGVGSVATQLAAKAGAIVVAPGLSEDEEYLRSLGVSEVLPREGDVVAAVRELYSVGVDALLDLVNYEPGGYAGALKDGARVASSTGAAGEGEGRTNVMAEPTRKNLERVGRLLSTGELKVPVQDTYEIDRAPQALQALGGTHTQGKLAIKIA